MATKTTRVVRLGMASYIDADGVPRIGLHGEEVLVHADHVARFDRLNGTPQDTPAPKRRRPKV